MKIRDDSGQTWRVHRRWLPWNPKAHKRDTGDAAEFADGDWDIFIILLLALPILLLTILVALEIVLLAIVLPFAIAGRILFGRRWWVQVRRGRTLVYEVMAGNWSESGTQMKALTASAAEGAFARHPKL